MEIRRKQINRIAFLEEYRDCPLDLIPLVSEVAQKGYRSVAISVSNTARSIDAFGKIAEEARTCDLGVAAFTGYMKYQDKHLRENPDQKLILSGSHDVEDQDQVVVNWGCPFNPKFLNRYLHFLRELAEIENLEEVWINDEASLGFSALKLGCYCPTCSAQWARDFDIPMPQPPFEDSAQRVRFARWRFDRWNQVHGRMREILNEARTVRAVFLTSPAYLFELESWVSGLDYFTMLEQVDGLMTDPYYTAHSECNDFLPGEVYLSECSRYIASLCGKAKASGICAQGFSHPTFLRPLDERDGYWSSVIPAAHGIEEITCYSYILQKSSVVQKPYERCFELDHYFNELQPWHYVGVVDSSLSEMCHEDTEPWRKKHMLQTAEALRRCGISYSYISAENCQLDELNGLGAIALGGVSVITDDFADRLKTYVTDGGCLVAFGPTGLLNADGSAGDQIVLAELFGVKIGQTMTAFAELDDDDFDQALLGPIPPAECHGFMGGTLVPAFVLHETRQIEILDEQTRVAVRFRDPPGAPAVTIRGHGKGKCIYFAGTPSRIFRREGSTYGALNLIDTYIASLLKAAASRELLFEPIDFPPVGPMTRNRPMDRRNTPTVEILPLAGEDMLMAVVPSYFREAQSFGLKIRIPKGKKVAKVTELIGNQAMDYEAISDSQMVLRFNLTEQDFLKVAALFLA
jgi:hypothetical protein